jgi:glycosylphosphatidylinositol transamidase (GPIT) subunit GPI8
MKNRAYNGRHLGRSHRLQSCGSRAMRLLTSAILLLGVNWSAVNDCPPPQLLAMASQDPYVVIASTSRYWHNYRHATNALRIYRLARQGGIPDERIILMLAENPLCDARNPRRGELFADASLSQNLSPCGDTEVDLEGHAVTGVTLMQTLLGQLPPDAPGQLRFDSNSNSTVLVYVTGHSGDSFMKWHDVDFMSSRDFSYVAAAMHRLGRFGKLLWLVDTCKAETLMWGVGLVPNAVAWASSSRESNSYSHSGHNSEEIGNALVDTWTYELAALLDVKRKLPRAQRSIRQLHATLQRMVPLGNPQVFAGNDTLLDQDVASFLRWTGGAPPVARSSRAMDASSISNGVPALPAGWIPI